MRNHRRRCSARLFGVVALISFLAACATVPITGRRQLRFYSDERIAVASDLEFFRFLAVVDEKQARLLPTESPEASRVIEFVTKVSNDIVEAAGVQRRHWDVVVVKASEANAVATPGGKIIVFAGLLPVAEGEAGLAAVIGHEVGHLVAQHAAERLSEQMTAQFAATLVENLAKPEYRETVAMVAGLGLQYGFLLPFNRLQELEADRLGQLFMAKAGYDPAEAIRLWERMEARHQSGPWEFLSTHPSEATRREYLERWLPEAMAFYEDRSRPLPSTADELAELRKQRESRESLAPVAPRPSFRPDYWWRAKSTERKEPITALHQNL